jgi:UbiD family decarboxylase
VPFTLLRTRPRRVAGGPVFAGQVEVGELPQLQCWPDDGGAFITLPQVYSEDPERPGPAHSNLGMYRIQLSGGQYQPNREVGLHYQIHRGIGVHHAAAIRRGEILRVNVYVGGPPAMTLAAVMPLPEGVSELAFAGALGGRRVRLAEQKGWPLPVHADADFCLLAEVDPEVRKPEGPFGDHLGYYSLAHDFPVLRVRRIYHRAEAIWPFTVVGRPPQEDSVLGALIHEITGPVISSALPGVHAVHAVDAAGVHPLLLALGSERYVPFEERQEPQELLTQANAILGQGQLSLAKYLFMAAVDDDPQLDVHDVSAFLQHVLARVDWRRDLHFQTQTTIDTLDYSGTGLNRGSKLVVAAVGRPRRTLPTALPPGLRLPDGFADARVCLPGVLAVRAPATGSEVLAKDFAAFCVAFQGRRSPVRLPAGGSGRRQRVLRPQPRQLPLGDFLAIQSGHRRGRHRSGHGAQALGLPGIAGDRRPPQTSPRTPVGGGSAGHRPRRRFVCQGRPARGPRVKETARWGDPASPSCECRTGLEGAGTGVAARGIGNSAGAADGARIATAGGINHSGRSPWASDRVVSAVRGNGRDSCPGAVLDHDRHRRCSGSATHHHRIAYGAATLDRHGHRRDVGLHLHPVAKASTLGICGKVRLLCASVGRAHLTG